MSESTSHAARDYLRAVYRHLNHAAINAARAKQAGLRSGAATSLIRACHDLMAEVDADRLEMLDHDHDPTHQTDLPFLFS